ncbi:hypothetical protein I7I51_06822 [Histoplasma capsulatum]|uniref:Uncharacterized protein n=1 Tax=Ajellomyces capsulatus TaxID=5037 RepID=A0A8A1MIS2_AJECA|nr:hypothetical protein I7I51_06822 [Histoplasma capsulatum]
MPMPLSLLVLDYCPSDYPEYRQGGILEFSSRPPADTLLAFATKVEKFRCTTSKALSSLYATLREREQRQQRPWMTASTTQLLTYSSASSVTSFSDWLRFRARVANAEGQLRPSSSRCSPSPSRFIYRRIFDLTHVAYPLPLHAHFLPASNLLMAGGLACHHPKAARFPEKSAPAHKEIPLLSRA